MKTPRFRHYIAGKFVDAGQSFADVNPATGQAFADVGEASVDLVDQAVMAARTAYRGPWGRTTSAERAAILRKIANGVDARFDALVAAEVEDAGMPISLARSVGIPRCAAALRTYADLIASATGEHLETRLPDGSTAVNDIVRTPIGVVALICPWNLPLLLLSWKVAPALAMGNTVVLKPSENTPATATLFAEIVHEAGIPPGVFNVVHGFGADSTGDALVRHPEIKAISFTGESHTGSQIQAASAPTLKKLSFELGGKNPALVFSDCDFNAALAGCARSVFAHAGQICLSTERIYVARAIFEPFVEALRKAATNVVVGDPRDAKTIVGPLISTEQRDRVLSYYRLAIDEGATLVAGGATPHLENDLAKGTFVEPTVWTGLPNSARVAREEVFGPVCHVAPFDEEDEAIRLANDSEYGLSATIWTRDVARAHRVARALEVGTTWVNSWLIRELRAPFGGLKRSGIGREGGKSSLDFFSEQQTICIALT